MAFTAAISAIFVVRFVVQCELPAPAMVIRHRDGAQWEDVIKDDIRRGVGVGGPFRGQFGPERLRNWRPELAGKSRAVMGIRIPAVSWEKAVCLITA